MYICLCITIPSPLTNAHTLLKALLHAKGSSVNQPHNAQRCCVCSEPSWQLTDQSLQVTCFIHVHTKMSKVFCSNNLYFPKQLVPKGEVHCADKHPNAVIASCLLIATKIIQSESYTLQFDNTLIKCSKIKSLRSQNHSHIVNKKKEIINYFCRFIDR